jgi:hypothetical protein
VFITPHYFGESEGIYTTSLIKSSTNIWMDPVPVFLTDDPSFFLDKVKTYLEANRASLPDRVSQLTSQLTRLCVIDETVNTRMVFKALKDAGLVEVYGGRVHRGPLSNVDISRYFPGAPPIILKIAEKAVAWVHNTGMELHVVRDMSDAHAKRALSRLF